MKRMNKKLITLMFAGALCAGMLGATSFNEVTSSAATAQPYEVSSVFTTTDVTIDAEGETDGEKTTAFVFKDEGSIALKQRDLAFKWYEGKGKDGERYLNFDFAFKDFNFESVTFTIESASAWATEDDKAVNTLTFTNDGSVLSVAVNGGTAVSTSITVGAPIAFMMAEGEKDGEYKISLNDDELSESFTNIGANYSDYSEGFKPLTVKAELAEGKENTTMLLSQINGQRFDNATKTDSKVSVLDTAAPVLVLNEEFSGFQLGTTFALSYEKIDVLQTSGLSETKMLYQYNPSHTASAPEYKNFTTAPYFSDSVYEKDGVSTSVYAQTGMEYVSLKVKVGDKSFSVDPVAGETKDFEKKVYDLSWYVSETVALDEKLGETREAYKLDYIRVDQNSDGPKFEILTLNTTDKTNDKTEEYDSVVKYIQDKVTDTAATLKSNESMKLPSCKELISDNNGYRNLQFKISYYKPSATSANVTSTLSSGSLLFTASEEGSYKFRIFATDKAGNAMKYYDENGELVEVTSSNVWDIENIPEFTFTIQDWPLQVKDATSTSSMKSTEVLDTSYTMSTFTVLGATSMKSDYALYIIDEEKANAIGLSADDLTKIKYSQLQTAIENRFSEVVDKDYFAFYLKVYSELLVDQVNSGVTAEQVYDCFVAIEEYNDKIDEDDHPKAWEDSDNKFNWKPSSRSFTTAEEGNYVILADLWEAAVPAQRTTAFKVVIVESEKISIKGDVDPWYKENILSVVLFSIAAVMLVLIIILLLVKPSDETLEDVDARAKAVKKATKKSKKK